MDLCLLSAGFFASLANTQIVPSSIIGRISKVFLYINSVFATLTQLGVGPSEGFVIVDKNDNWEQFTDDNILIESVKSYIYLKVKLLFDPPTSSAVIESYKQMINEFEWRLNVAAE